MGKTITVNTGERIEVQSPDGKVMGYFYFNPADLDIMRRCSEAQENIEQILGKVRENPTAEAVIDFNRNLREQMAYILGEGAADVLFKYNSPLALMPDGTLYGEYVFDIILAFIESEVKERTEKSMQQVEKYTAKYQP